MRWFTIGLFVMVLPAPAICEPSRLAVALSECMSAAIRAEGYVEPMTGPPDASLSLMCTGESAERLFVAMAGLSHQSENGSGIGAEPSKYNASAIPALHASLPSKPGKRLPLPLKFLASSLAIIWLSGQTHAQTVTDGDTIKLAGTTYRLWGIDAPETRQTCADGWPAGHKATAELEQLMAGHAIACEPRTQDRYGRTVALCRADGQDLGAAMVSAGMALAFTRYSSDYVEQEKAAIGARAGVHGHDCAKPWDWRARQRR